MSDRKTRYGVKMTLKEGMSLDERQAFLDNVHKIEDSIRDRDTERLVILDDEGNEIVGWDGKTGEVSITLPRAMAMRGRIATHNHPNNSALSDGDVHNLVLQDMQEMRAVTRNGFVYSLRRIGTTEKTDRFADDYRNIGYAWASKAVYNEWHSGRGGQDKFTLPNGLVDREAWTAHRFNFYLRRWMMGKAKEYGFEYTEGRGK